MNKLLKRENNFSVKFGECILNKIKKSSNKFFKYICIWFKFFFDF